MDVVCYRMKLKPGTRQAVDKWADYLNQNKSEVLELLKNEGVFVESVFLDQINGEDFLIYYMRAENIEHARQVARSSAHPIDAYHSEIMKQVTDSASTLKSLVDFSR